MRRTRCLLVVVAMLGSGCALQDARYDYSRLAAGLGDYDESIIDWNFPTSTNQGPLLPPERFRPVRPAIGVPWATSDPAPWRYGETFVPAPTASESAPHDATRACATDCDGAAASADAVTFRGREPSAQR